MIRVVSGFKVGYGLNASTVMPERFLTEESAEKATVRYSELHNIDRKYYRVSSCFLLEVQSERGPVVHFDLGNPVELER